MVATNDLSVYRQEVFTFLSTVTIKYTPFIAALDALVESKGYQVDTTAPSKSKYYLNITGEYHPTDTMMTITSLDTQTVINFTKDVLVDHPRTVASYVAGSSYVTELIARYPDQADLIKSILYPVADINTAIAADNLTILSYGTGILEDTEEGPIIQEIEKFLNYYTSRWYMDFFSYVPAWPWIFWGSLWHRIAECIFAARIKFIKTPFVHSWHVWEELTSKGLDDYRGSLSREQQMFLYRNIDYLLANRGKASNLRILADNILNEIGVGLFSRQIYQDTYGYKDQTRLTPDLVAIQIPTSYSGAVQSLTVSNVADINRRLTEAGYETGAGAEYDASVERALGSTIYNKIPTKILEIRPVSRDRQYATFFNRFVIDTLVHLITNNVYQTTIAFTDPYNGIDVVVTPKQALGLYFYCAQKAFGETIDVIPDQYYLATPFKDVIPEVPTTISLQGFEVPITALVDIDHFMDIPKYPSILKTPDAYSESLEDLFEAALRQVMYWRASNQNRVRKVMKSLRDLSIINQVVPLDLTNGAYTTYTQWLQNDFVSATTKIFDAYDQSNDPKTLYSGLADTIMSALIPTQTFFTKYGSFTASYTELRDLFISLCSYNVVFLDTDVDDNRSLFVTSICLDMDSMDVTQTLGIAKERHVSDDTVHDITFEDASKRLIGTVLVDDSQYRPTAARRVGRTDSVSHAMEPTATKTIKASVEITALGTVKTGRKSALTLSVTDA